MEIDHEDARTRLADGAPVRLRGGAEVSITGCPTDARGVRPFANDAVVWTVPDTRVGGRRWADMSGTRVADDHVYFLGGLPGTATVTATAGAVTRRLTVVTE